MKEIIIRLENHKIINISTLRWLLKLFNIQIRFDPSLTAKNIRCPLCDEKMSSYWHRISKPLVDALLKLYLAGGVSHLRDLNLTVSQNNNFQKLHYFELAKSDGTGEYTIEDRGVDFLLGRIKIPKKVRTFRNEVIEKSDELVGVKNVDSNFEYPPDYSFQSETVAGPRMDSRKEIKFEKLPV